MIESKELEKIKHLENSLFLWEADRTSNEIAENVLKWFKSSHYIEYSSRRLFLPNYWELLNKKTTKEKLLTIFALKKSKKFL